MATFKEHVLPERLSALAKGVPSAVPTAAETLHLACCTDCSRIASGGSPRVMRKTLPRKFAQLTRHYLP